MDFISNQVQEKMKKAMQTFAKKNALPDPNQVQIIFSLNADGTAAVKMAYQYKPVQEVTFKEAIGVKVDIFAMANATEYFVQSALIDLTTSDEISADKISVMVVKKNNDEEDYDMVFHLYNDKTHVRKLSLEEIFDFKKLKTA